MRAAQSNPNNIYRVHNFITFSTALFFHVLIIVKMYLEAPNPLASTGFRTQYILMYTDMPHIDIAMLIVLVS